MEILKSNNTIKESGAKKSGITVFTDGRPVDKAGESLPFAVAMVAKCVAHYRKRLKPLKTVYLCPAHYNQFDYWARTHMIEKEADAKIKLWTFDGAEIELMAEDHVIRGFAGDDTMDWDFYPEIE